MRHPRAILITGASSGIGEALAVDYAGPGVFLALGGRDRARLDAVAAACRAKGADVRVAAIDVADRETTAQWVSMIDQERPIDLVIANAGVGLEKGGLEGAGSKLDEDAIRRTFAINLDGVLNTVLPLIPAMRGRQQGQIALMASLAGFVGLPRSAAYNASKAAVRVWGESLRPMLQADHIGVSVICPGFVTSRLTAKNKFRMPFLMSAAQASAIIRRGLARNKARIAFPLPTKSAVWLAGVLPGGLTARLMGRGAPR
jgi:short-subunit dehydrogenase